MDKTSKGVKNVRRRSGIGVRIYHNPRPASGPVEAHKHPSKRSGWRQKAISLIEATRTHQFAENVCFLCGKRLVDKSHGEHVFPKWLQQRFGLSNETLTLLNGTTIAYRKLKIPCCKTCNNEHLSRIENTVQRAFDKGFAAVNKLDRLTLFLWTAKIFFGLLYRELFLPVDRRIPGKGPIVKHLKPFQLVHYFIQGLRLPITFQSADADFPGTLFLFRLQRPRHPKVQFDFHDDVVNQCVYMRLGEVGLLASFDAGAQAISYKEMFCRYARCTLHPQQFEELGARLFYNARLFNRNPPHLFTDSGPDDRAYVFVGPIAGLSEQSVFDPGNKTTYAQLLSRFVYVPLQTLHPAPNKVMTFLHRPDGRFMRLDLRRIPYRGIH